MINSVVMKPFDPERKNYRSKTEIQILHLKKILKILKKIMKMKRKTMKRIS